MVGEGESRASEIGVKATEAAKGLEAQPPRTPRPVGLGAFRW